MSDQKPFLQQIELSVRAGNVLQQMNPDMNYNEFMALTKKQVLSLRNAGSRTWREVQEVQDYFREAYEKGPVTDPTPGWSRCCDLLGEVNHLLMQNPRLRVVVNADASLTLAMTDAETGAALNDLRRVLREEAV